jgi:hypothetical protein
MAPMWRCHCYLACLILPASRKKYKWFPLKFLIAPDQPRSHFLIFAISRRGTYIVLSSKAWVLWKSWTMEHKFWSKASTHKPPMFDCKYLCHTSRGLWWICEVIGLSRLGLRLYKPIFLRVIVWHFEMLFWYFEDVFFDSNWKVWWRYISWIFVLWIILKSRGWFRSQSKH